jgi:interferon-induced GTP-binding protein Mx1
MRNLVEQRLGGNRSSSQPEEPLVTTSSLLSGFKQHVRPLLELNAFLEREVVPILRQGRSSDAAQASTARIVVVGDQSHGKTSLLEALSTVDLPRGEGIKTRCPLVLQLRGLREGGGSECAFISAPEIAEQRIGDLSQISRAVEEMTERLAGTPKDLIAT